MTHLKQASYENTKIAYRFKKGMQSLNSWALTPNYSDIIVHIY